LVCLFIYLFWPDLKLCPNGGTKQTVHIIVGVAIGAVCLLLFLGNPLVGRLFVEKKRGKTGTGSINCLILKLLIFLKKKLADSEIDLIAST
jgi:hypothetical protein